MQPPEIARFMSDSPASSRLVSLCKPPHNAPIRPNSSLRDAGVWVPLVVVTAGWSLVTVPGRASRNRDPARATPSTIHDIFTPRYLHTHLKFFPHLGCFYGITSSYFSLLSSPSFHPPPLPFPPPFSFTCCYTTLPLLLNTLVFFTSTGFGIFCHSLQIFSLPPHSLGFSLTTLPNLSPHTPSTLHLLVRKT